MAKEVLTILRCDWHNDGTEADRTVPFKDGDVRFEIDLCTACRAELRSGARRIKPRNTKVHGTANTNGHRRKARKRGAKPAEIRAWARGEGMEVSDNGRIPADIAAAYRQSVNA